MIGWLLSVIICGVLIVASPSKAQEYPTKVVTMVVPFAAGGPTDTVARLLGVPMSKTLKQQVIIENVGGAGGTIAANRVAKATPDGYTLLLSNIGTHAVNVHLMKSVPFDPVKDFTPIALLGVLLISLSATNSLPAGTVRDLIAYMKANPGKLNYGSYGIATTNNVAMALFNLRAGV